jgi:nicotinamidase-related amidase
MTNQSSIDPARPAVLSMDLQAGIISIYAKDDASFVERAAPVLGKARELGIHVIHVQVGFRKKLPEVSPRNSLFAAIKNSERHQRLFEGDLGAIHPMLGPTGDDIVVVKHRVSAFAGSDLEMILRANEIDTLVLFGIATSGSSSLLSSMPWTWITGSSWSKIAASIRTQSSTPHWSKDFFPCVAR